MKHVIGTGTDIASVGFFDPAALPEVFDMFLSRDYRRAHETLVREGRLWTCNTGADGAYLFHFYIDTPVPPPVLEHAKDPEAIDRFHVPSGILWVSGEEYVARDPVHGRLGKHPHMGGKFELPAGEYAVTAWRMEWPEDAIEQELARRIGKRNRRWENRIGVITGMLLFGLIFGGGWLLLVTVFSLGTPGGLTSGQRSGWLVIGPAIVACVMGMRWLTRQEDNPLRREIEARFPSIVVQLRKCA